MPSHSWPVVSGSVELCGSRLAIAVFRLLIGILLKRDLGIFLEALLVAGPKGVDHHADEEGNEEEKCCDLRDAGHLLRLGHAAPQIRPGRVELGEVDQRPEHLQIRR